MKIIVNGEKQFSVLKNSFVIGPSESGYQLAFSATGNPDEFTEYGDPVQPGDNCMVNGVASEAYFKLIGNTGDVVIKY